LRRQKENQSIKLERETDAGDVDVKEDITENLGFAEFVLERWLQKEKFLVLKKQVGEVKK